MPLTSDDPYTNRLYEKIREELSLVFEHDAEKSHDLLEIYNSNNPLLDEDFYWHQGPFNVALRVHYELVLGGDAAAIEFIEWRKQFNSVWEARRK